MDIDTDIHTVDVDTDIHTVDIYTDIHTWIETYIHIHTCIHMHIHIHTLAVLVWRTMTEESSNLNSINSSSHPITTLTRHWREVMGRLFT